MEIKEKIVSLTKQKDIALSFIGKPTKNKHYKAIIAVYKRYEYHINEIFKINCSCDFNLRESNGNITHTFICDKCKNNL